MNPLLQPITAAPATEFVKSKHYYHGTSAEAGEQIIQHGFLYQESTYEKGDLAPQEGRAYFTPSFYTAVAYAWDRAAHGSADDLYIFEVSGKQFHDLSLDEDVVMALLEQVRLKSNNLKDPFKSDYLEFGLDLSQPLTQAQIHNPAISHMMRFFKDQGIMIQEESGGWEWSPVIPTYQRHAKVKEALYHMPDGLVRELMNLDINVASEADKKQRIWPSKLYIIPQEDLLAATTATVSAQTDGLSPATLQSLWEHNDIRVVYLPPHK